MIGTSLFDPVSVASVKRGGFGLRDYQLEAADAFFAALQTGKKKPLCRLATGLGKSIWIADVAGRLKPKRVMVMVDVGILATDLWKTIHTHTGEPVGILTGEVKEGWRSRRIVVATVQSLYAGGVGAETFRQFDPSQFCGLLIDECESALADRFRDTVNWFAGNPDLVVGGTTATPMRGDGRGMGEVFDHADNEPGPLNRDILWGRDNGWLVHVKQGFVRVSLDFSSLKLRKDEEGQKDYSEAELAKLFEDEQKVVELAKGIHRVAAGEPSIVICPQSVELAKVLAYHLDAEQRGCAEVVYGEQGRRADDILARYKRRSFPYIVSVNKLYKGFDADCVKYVFMCRKTKSRRLYEQAMGRGTRPLSEIRGALNAAKSAEERRAIIAASDKPFMVMVDMVGVDESAKDLGVIDVLGSSMTEKARERAKKKLLKSGAHEQDVEPAGREAAKQVADEERRAAEAEERRKRRAVSVSATVDVEFTDDLNVGRGGGSAPEAVVDRPSEKQINLLIAYGMDPDRVRSMGRRQLSAIIGSYRDQGKYPNWDLVRAAKPNQSPSRMTEMPISQWQVGKLNQLRYDGPMPRSHAAARTLIIALTTAKFKPQPVRAEPEFTEGVL